MKATLVLAVFRPFAVVVTTMLIAPFAAGAAMFFALVYFRQHIEGRSLRAYLLGASPLYVITLSLGAVLIRSATVGDGFWEFGGIVLILFLVFLGGIFGDALYFLTSRRGSSRE
ncbi:MAG: hypothetical protein JJD97_11915 [Gemmatimonadaceae bacterium]|nr:hypothetical protein [Gemmatimonadaceae bacterium]